MSLGSTISALATEDVVVLRATGGGYGPDGRVSSPTFESRPIRAVVHPASGADVDILPEGNRLDETIRVYARVPLRSVTPTTSPDVLIWRDVKYEVVTAFDRAHDGGFHIALATRRVTQ